MRLFRPTGTLPRMPNDASIPIEDEPLPFWRPPEGALPPGAWFGMTTRRGGRSVGPYATFNVSLGVGDDEGAVAWNRAKLARALGYPGTTPALLNQVHGADVVTHLESRARADGFLVRTGEPWVAVSAADCAPVAIVSADGAHGALLHSGWRGTRAGIAGEAVRRLADRCRPGELHAVIGPCIHACCFPVGPDVAREFDETLRRPHASGQEAIDLPGAIRRSLLASGVADERIRTASECTSCERETFFSHRRDRGLTGRHWAFLRLA
ncbi:MAG TPA: polyphenol oxidase family protein [Candidatus Eisenbacteria bacterium]|nr:polyphenol oxidase family protein [Candidatus Eisenbacteria bacterium]